MTRKMKAISGISCCIALFLNLIAGCEEMVVYENHSSLTSGVLQGTVREVITGEPVPDITVRLSVSEVFTKTDENGLYKFQNAPQGDDTLWVESGKYEMVNEPTYIPDEGSMSVDFDLIPYYPVTDSAPALEFHWGTPEDTLDIRNDIMVASPFAYDEQGTRSQEMAIFLTNRSRDPVYAFCSGVVTYWKPWSEFIDAAEPDRGGEVWIRYGKNYAIGFRHVVTVHPETGEPVNWQVGQRVDAGDILAYTADWGEGSESIFYEFVLAKQDAEHYYFLKAYDYFPPTSQITLLRIWEASQIKDASFGYSLVESPWGDMQLFESDGGDQEIPFKGRL